MPLEKSALVERGERGGDIARRLLVEHFERVVHVVAEFRIGVLVGERHEDGRGAVPHIGVAAIGFQRRLGDLILDAGAVIDGDEMGVVGLVRVAELPVIARPVALDGHRAAVVVAGGEAAGMGRSRRAVGDDILGLAALRRFVEMHHLLDQPEILLGQLEHDLIDMGVADLDVAAVDRGIAVEHDAVAESVAQAELMRRRVNCHQLAQRVDQRLARGRGHASGLGHLGDDEANRQQRLALIELAARRERSDERRAARAARIGEEGIEVAVQHLQAQGRVGRGDDSGKLWRKLDGDADRIELAGLDLAGGARDLDAAKIDRRRIAQGGVEPRLQAPVDGLPLAWDDEAPVGGEAEALRLLGRGAGERSVPRHVGLTERLARQRG